MTNRVWLGQSRLLWTKCEKNNCKKNIRKTIIRKMRFASILPKLGVGLGVSRLLRCLLIFIQNWFDYWNRNQAWHRYFFEKCSNFLHSLPVGPWNAWRKITNIYGKSRSPWLEFNLGNIFRLIIFKIKIENHLIIKVRREVPVGPKTLIFTEFS